MAVSIADMERVALGGDSLRFDDGGIGNVIELGDLNDDLGLNMLMNPSKAGGGSSGMVTAVPDSSRTVNITSFTPPPQPSSSYGGSGSSIGIDSTPLEPLEPIVIDSSPIDMNDFGARPIDVSVKKENGGMFGGLFGNSQSATGPGITLATAQRDPEAEKKEKTEFLNKLQRLEQKGFPVARKFTMDNSLEEVKAEYFRLVDARNLETSIKFQRQMLMGAITGMEWLNGRFDPFDIKLDGWSESVHENVEDFDEIFEELYDKYKDRGKMSPEMRLVMAIGGSGFMCHVSNSFFRSKMPTMDDVLKRNPELARQMAAAAASQAGPGFGNFMGMAMGVQPPAQQAPQQPPSYSANGGPGAFHPATAMPPTGAFYGASGGIAAPSQEQPQRQTARREMSGPTGVDDILRTFEEVRRAENDAASMPPMATGFATQPAVAAVMSSSASAVSAEDMMSHADSAMTGGTSGRRRRRAQPPVGNTLSLNV
ncbi:MAG: hypothetical protein EBV30_10010 [Actinobacteria bacterium]|nr:hypothetical protein [Actinomycetota bacterium]